MKIILNKIQCKKCGDILESKTVHDTHMCKCGAVGIDGGHDYFRRFGVIEDVIDLSVVEPEDDDLEPEEIDWGEPVGNEVW